MLWSENREKRLRERPSEMLREDGRLKERERVQRD